MNNFSNFPVQDVKEQNRQYSGSINGMPKSGIITNVIEAQGWILFIGLSGKAEFFVSSDIDGWWRREDDVIRVSNGNLATYRIYVGP